EVRRAANVEGRARRLHGHLEPQAQRSHPRRQARRSDRPRRPVVENECRGARASEPAAGCRKRRRAEVDGDSPAPGKGTSHHAAERAAVLAAGRRKASLKSEPPTAASQSRSFLLTKPARSVATASKQRHAQQFYA